MRKYTHFARNEKNNKKIMNFFVGGLAKSKIMCYNTNYLQKMELP